MAIIYSYPQGTPTLGDNVVGTQVDPVTEENNGKRGKKKDKSNFKDEEVEYNPNKGQVRIFFPNSSGGC